jgi:hypothetical protein
MNAPTSVRLKADPTTRRRRSSDELSPDQAKDGSSGWTRTSNPPVNSRMLCH